MGRRERGESFNASICNASLHFLIHSKTMGQFAVVTMKLLLQNFLMSLGAVSTPRTYEHLRFITVEKSAPTMEGDFE